MFYIYVFCSLFYLKMQKCKKENVLIFLEKIVTRSVSGSLIQYSCSAILYVLKISFSNNILSEISVSGMFP
jgi:hypothetical protein